MSIAYDKGEMEIYNYLKSKGAIEFEPKPVVQAPAQQAAPASGGYSAPPPVQQSTTAPSRSTGAKVVQNLQKSLESPLDSGKYKMSSGNEELSFAGIAKSGMVSHKDASGKISNGSYSIDGNRLQINVLGKTYFYTITSKTSFSGNVETWYRSGY